MTSILYLDFDLQIECAEQGYRAQIGASPTGEASQSFTVPFSDAELEKFLVLAGRPRAPVRSGAATDVAAAQVFGGRLFETLFNHQIRDGLQSSLNEAERQGKGLRIRLRFNDAPELADIPWEYFYRADADRFLALSAKMPLVRYLELSSLHLSSLHLAAPLQATDLIVGNGDDIDIGTEYGFFRITAPTQAFDLTSFTNGYNGKLLMLVNLSSQNMTIKNDTGSAPTNRIMTRGGVAVVIPNNQGSAWFIYKGTNQRWVFMGSN